MEECGCCHGEGYVQCPICGGSGEVPSERKFGRRKTCENCGGCGEVECRYCGGRGEVPADDDWPYKEV